MHELFVAGEVDASYLDSTPLRRVVAESWQRSLAKGVDPDRGGAQSSSVALSVARMRDVHPLASALPVIRRLLVSDAVDSGVVVAITAADGTLLWVEGDRTACRKVEAMNFVPGADWSERGAERTRRAPRWRWIVNCRSVGRSTSRGWSSRGVVRPYRCTISTPGR